ncbi:hypothetical protein XCV3141 [Xanthomonas euvesicatoria pv. vesicatoria str. 85-10]|uniref:Uncharacterized protein n=1 Tax=Xanthomonas euvesicatoria pv. vesicatoria (strain 85-10) TaxID=316273 RepID=Q3BQU1_XANE5|nr:hypothetical protein XCV3141 [Xanthomonas euvesicatoria pv. vesicatoria str. 85-10]
MAGDLVPATLDRASPGNPFAGRCVFDSATVHALIRALKCPQAVQCHHHLLATHSRQRRDVLARDIAPGLFFAASLNTLIGVRLPARWVYQIHFGQSGNA